MLVSSALMIVGAVLAGISIPTLTASAASVGYSPILLTATTGGLENVGTVFTQIGTWMSSMVETITSAPILLIGLGIFVFGAVIGLAYRLIRG